MAQTEFGNITPLFYGGFQSLTDEGIGAWIEKKYNDTARKSLWWAYDGMWTAAASGIGKGLLMAAGVAVAAHMGAGLWEAMAGNLAEPTVINGLSGGFAGGVNFLTTTGMGATMLGIGAAIGGAYDVHNRQDTIRTELAETRKMMREVKHALKEKELAVVQSILEKRMAAHITEPETETSIDAANDKPPGYWQQREASRATPAQTTQQAL